MMRRSEFLMMPAPRRPAPPRAAPRRPAPPRAAPETGVERPLYYYYRLLKFLQRYVWLVNKFSLDHLNNSASDVGRRGKNAHFKL
jgi:hypothetical protein